jgi:hypothetical protein
MTTKRQRILLPLTALVLVLMLGVLAGCGAPPAMPSDAPAPAAQVAQEVTPTPTHTPTPTPSPTPTPTPDVPTPTATPENLTIVVPEAQAQEMAEEALAKQDQIQISNVVVDFRPGEMLLSGDTKIGFFSLNIGLLGTVEAVAGKADITIKEIYVNGDPATGFIRDEIEKLIAPQLKNLKLVESKFYVEDVVITDEDMTITGRYK